MWLEPVDMGLMRGSYTITPAGLEYLDVVSASEPLAGSREDTEIRAQGWIPRRFQMELIDARKQLQEERSEERTWWRRMFGG